MMDVSKELIKEFNLRKLKCDFMGYQFHSVSNLSFHHLLLSRQQCKLQQVPMQGYVKWNGVMLVRDTSHDYLHIIEDKDEEIFYLITSELLDEKIEGRITKEHLLRIKALLMAFEREHEHDTNSHGKLLLKPKFYTNRIDLDNTSSKYLP